MIAPATKTHCLSLIRVSGAGQLDGDGPDRQRSVVQKYADAHEYEIVHEVFGEKSQSGAVLLQERMDLMECLALCDELDVHVVLTEDAHRLSRDSVQHEMAVREFQAAGVQVISATSGVDLTKGDVNDPTSKLIRQLLAAVAEWDKDTLVLKLRVARERKKQRTNGKEGKEGIKPYGSKDGEQAGLDLIATRLAAGDGPQAIANQLNQAGIFTRCGNSWTRGSVHRIAHRLR